MSLTVEKCLQAWSNSLRQMNAKADIVFFGDSLTYYGDFSSVFPDKVVCNLGLRGDTIQGMIDRVQLVSMLAPKVIFLMAGINDIASSSFEKFVMHYELLIKRLLEVAPSTVIIQSLLPVNTADYTISCTNEQIIYCNSLISKIASEYNLQYIDLYSQYAEDSSLPKDCTVDGLHLNDEAYAKWYQYLRCVVSLYKKR